MSTAFWAWAAQPGPVLWPLVLPTVYKAKSKVQKMLQEEVARLEQP